MVHPDQFLSWTFNIVRGSSARSRFNLAYEIGDYKPVMAIFYGLYMNVQFSSPSFNIIKSSFCA